MNIPDEILFTALDAMMNAPLYMSDKTHPPDFKYWKWEPYRDEAAEEIIMAHRALLDAMLVASGLQVEVSLGCPATNLAGEFCCYRKGHSDEFPHRMVKHES